MCKIMEDLYKEGQEEGRQEGRQEGIQEGMAKGKQEGIQEGKKEGCISIALNALKMSLLSHVDIAKMTGLTLDEVEELAAKME